MVTVNVLSKPSLPRERGSSLSPHWRAVAPTYPVVLLLQTVQAFRLALLPNIWLVEDEVLPTALLCQQTGMFGASHLPG